MARRTATRPARPPHRNRWRAYAIGLAVGLVALIGVAWLALSRPSPRDRAEASERAGDWPKALEAYRDLIRTGPPRARDRLGEGRALLALDRAREAEIALRQATSLDPADPDPLHLLMELFRVERRGVEAHDLGWSGLATVSAEGRRGILRDLTLALLFLDTPLDARAEDKARETLSRWVASDPSDHEAFAALSLRIAADPRPDDPDRASRISELSIRLDLDPGRVSLREALIVTLADEGDVDRGRSLLDLWPEPLRDVRYDRLRGRWDLDYDRRPSEAAAAFLRVLAVLPHDWKTHYRLSRALKTLGREADSAREAESVARIRERLDPSSLATRIARNLARLDAPESLRDLASLCSSVGLSRLAAAWESEATRVR